MVQATSTAETTSLPEQLANTVILDKSKITHLIFIDIWRSYEGLGDEVMVASLPEAFLHNSQQVWLQPEINVTQAQLSEFQQYFPKITPLILDRNSKIMRSLNVWKSPYHVLLQGNKKLFSGDGNALTTYISKEYLHDGAIIAAPIKQAQKPSAFVVNNVIATDKNQVLKLHKPMPGDHAPDFSLPSMQGQFITLQTVLNNLITNKTLSIVFMDSLCPMPHFPDCQQKLAQLNKLVEDNKDRQWLGIISSFYVNEDSAEQFSKKFDINMPLIFDHKNATFKAYDVYATPYQVDVNSEGTITSRTSQLH